MANAYTVMPWVFPWWPDALGQHPLNGGKLFTYAAGTTTKLTTYQSADPASAVAHANPIILNSAGRPPAPVYLQARNYKFVLSTSTDTDPPTSPIWTADNVAAAPPFNVDLDVTGTAGEALAANDCVYLSDGSAGKTAGSWYKADADFNYASTLPPAIGFAVSSTGSGSLPTTIRRMGRLTGLAGLTAGSKYYVSATAGAITATAPTLARRVGMADGTTSLVIAAEIPEPTIGQIELDLQTFREIAANDIPATAADAGMLSSNTTPTYSRVNLATDKALRIAWAAANVDEITARFSYPADLDDSAAVTVVILAAMSGATNTPTMQVDYFEGVGDTNAGGATAAITGTTVAAYSRAIAASDVGAAPNFASISFTPGAHATDAVRLYAAYVKYTKKLLAT